MRFRNLALWSLLLLLSVLIAFLVKDRLLTSTYLNPNDFVEYWSAGHLSVMGENPYDAVRIYDLEKNHIGWDPVGEAIMMWNPPWTLSLVMPLGMLRWQTAHLAWLFLNFGLMTASAFLLQSIYTKRPQVALLIPCCWMAGYVALQMGQISTVILFGFSLFLVLEKRGWPFLAGLVCVLIAVKPHLVYLFWLGVLWHAISTREWRILAGGIVGGVLASVAPLLVNPQVFSQYLAASQSTPPSQWISPTIGAWIRVLSGDRSFVLQFLPMAIGLLAFARRLNRPFGSWSEQLPWMILVSLVTAPYGAWPYDLTLLSIAWIALLNRYPTRLAWSLFAAIALGFVAYVVFEGPAQYAVWISPTVLAAVLLVKGRGRCGETTNADSSIRSADE